MPSGVRGDFKRLHALRWKFNKLASAGFRREAIETLRQEAESLTKRGFRTSTDPYGLRWPPRVGSSSSPLLGGQGSVRSYNVANGFRIQIDVPYGRVHQRGARIYAKRAAYLKFQVDGQWVQKRSVTIPARRMVPDEHGLGPSWRKAFHKRLETLLWKRLK